MADTQDPNAPHEFMPAGNGRCAYGHPNACGRGEDVPLHHPIRAATGAGHPDSLRNASRRTTARRAAQTNKRRRPPVPWSRMNGPQRAALVLFGTGAGVVFLSACVALSAVLLRLAGVIG